MPHALKRLSLAALLLCGCAALGAEERRQPNFILIFVDDMGYGDLGCFGSEKNRTPHLDELAAEVCFVAHSGWRGHVEQPVTEATSCAG